MRHFSRDFPQITNGEEKSARFLIRIFRRKLVLFNNRTYPPIVRDEEGYKRNCCANSKVTKPFVFLLNFVNYKKLMKKIIKSLSTAKKFSFNNRTTPRCAFPQKQSACEILTSLLSSSSLCKLPFS